MENVGNVVKTRFRYVRDRKGHPRGLIMMQFPDTGMVQVGWSLCNRSEGDRFKRVDAKKFAKQRMVTVPVKGLSLPENLCATKENLALFHLLISGGIPEIIRQEVRSVFRVRLERSAVKTESKPQLPIQLSYF